MRAAAESSFEFYGFTVLVRDLDPQGHVANHVYVAYLSEARARYVRALDDGAEGLRPSVVAEMRCRYASPLLPWESFRVGVRLARVGRTSIGFAYQVRTADRLVADGDSTEVLVDPRTGRPRQIPNGARARLSALLFAGDARREIEPRTRSPKPALSNAAREKTKRDGIAPRSKRTGQPRRRLTQHQP